MENKPAARITKSKGRKLRKVRVMTRRRMTEEEFLREMDRLDATTDRIIRAYYENEKNNAVRRNRSFIFFS
jgi:hypothetical protein